MRLRSHTPNDRSPLGLSNGLLGSKFYASQTRKPELRTSSSVPSSYDDGVRNAG